MGVGTGGEGANQGMTWLTELSTRGVGDALVTCWDGLRGLPGSINAVGPQPAVQLCGVPLGRPALRYSAKHHWAALARAL
ncbi:transposase, partial [Streptomyces sp. GbtcB7]|uniref:transposase n=1 Tax=Streptomyces sp. GbtcB7 TaxID=2824752 RepID=UPI0034D617C3